MPVRWTWTRSAPDSGPAVNDISVMFPMMGGVFDTYNAELLRQADVMVVGRVSFALFQSLR